ncbi:G-protein coupled receptor GRL101-like [Physella acuta]|uniref:G-protein coupled receptor GRL101-like n=1 Tax=Physella acuta TaxID=109671 RepID=UPI0027DADA6F|nr:G-protein coupled receptor GRL101-like [Physella acuta]
MAMGKEMESPWEVKNPVYLLPIHVCDNKAHCPRGDDELGCHVTCPAGLECVMGAISPAIHPEQIILTSLSTLDIHARFLNLSGIDLSHIRGPGIPGDFCFAPQDAISSCEDLLGDQVKRILLWILAVVSVCGNLTVIVFRLVFERKRIIKSYRLFVTNLNISELIMGVYLFIIAGNDVYYRGHYVMYESEWRHSPLCTAAGFLATLSCETSALFVLLVTLERFLVIRFPLGPYRIKRFKKYFLLLVSWVFGIVLAVVPLVYPDWAVYSSNGMCLGLPIARKPESGWAYSFAVFLVFNCILFILIAMGQLAIFLAMSREKTQLQSSPDSLAKRRREIMVAKNLSLVVMSNFLCWFPICVIGLMTARGHTFSQQTYGWLAVFVLPLNSAVNPVIYTLPVVYEKWEDFKNGQTRDTPSQHAPST